MRDNSNAVGPVFSCDFEHGSDRHVSAGAVEPMKAPQQQVMLAQAAPIAPVAPAKQPRPTCSFSGFGSF